MDNALVRDLEAIRRRTVQLQIALPQERMVRTAARYLEVALTQLLSRHSRQK